MYIAYAQLTNDPTSIGYYNKDPDDSFCWTTHKHPITFNRFEMITWSSRFKKYPWYEKYTFCVEKV